MVFDFLPGWCFFFCPSRAPTFRDLGGWRDPIETRVFYARRATDPRIPE